jgi:acetolactate synthase-1/2/3 large subunit
MGTRVADLIVRGLERHGVERFYCVPGESYLALLDALHDSRQIKTIVCRHESGAGFMALSEAKMTRKPAVYAVTRGPGATNGSIAMHVAQQDAVPVVLLIGQVSRDERGRHAFQEIDYSHFFADIAKGVFEVFDADKMGETLARAFHLAACGVPGPVAISLPEDVLSDMTETAMPAAYPVHRPGADARDAEAIFDLLRKAERPLIMSGAFMRGERGAAALARFAEHHHVPVVCTWKNQDTFDNCSPLYAGHIGFGNPLGYREMLAKADLIIGCGARLGDISSLNYTLPRAPQPDQPFVHIYPDAGPIGLVTRTDLGVIADPASMLELLSGMASTASDARRTWAKGMHDFIADFTTFVSPQPEDGVDFGAVVNELSRQSPGNAVVVTDAGNMSTWVHRHWKLTPSNMMIGSIAGAMGIGVPGAVAASLTEPGRPVICVVGDGGALMTAQEIATAVQYGASPKIFISNNASYGTIRTHQERHYPARVSGTQLSNPDFTAWAKSFGVTALTIALGDDVAEKVAEALAVDGPCVVEVKSSLEAVSAFTTIGKLRGG